MTRSAPEENDFTANLLGPVPHRAELLAAGAVLGVVLATICGVIGGLFGAVCGVYLIDLTVRFGGTAPAVQAASDAAPWVGLASALALAVAVAALWGEMVKRGGGRRAAAVVAMTFAAAIGTAGSPSLRNGTLFGTLAAAFATATVTGATLLGMPRRDPAG